MVPDGLLVFFPAYSLLTACLDHWKASTGTAGGATIWERITRHKAPVIEPRDSGAFAAALADYAAKLEDPNGSGAVLFAVCRGKVGAWCNATIAAVFSSMASAHRTMHPVKPTNVHSPMCMSAIVE